MVHAGKGRIRGCGRAEEAEEAMRLAKGVIELVEKKIKAAA
jgi:hypothetical protein